MCEVIDQMLIEVENSKLPRKDYIFRILEQERKSINKTLKYDPNNKELLAKKIDYTKNQVRIWKTNESNRIEARKKLDEYTKKRGFNKIKAKLLDKLRSKLDKVKNCYSYEDLQVLDF